MYLRRHSFTTQYEPASPHDTLSTYDMLEDEESYPKQPSMQAKGVTCRY